MLPNILFVIVEEARF